jgi:hypothetical protein
MPAQPARHSHPGAKFRLFDVGYFRPRPPYEIPSIHSTTRGKTHAHKTRYAFQAVAEKGSRFRLACAIIDAARIGHVVHQEQQPMVPSSWRDKERLLLHGSVVSLLMKHLPMACHVALR